MAWAVEVQASPGVAPSLRSVAGQALGFDSSRLTAPAVRLQSLLTSRRAEQTAREAARPTFRRDLLGNLVPHVRAAAAIVYDPQTGEVLWEENMHDRRPIASCASAWVPLSIWSSNVPFG